MDMCECGNNANRKLYSNLCLTCNKPMFRVEETIVLGTKCRCGNELTLTAMVSPVVKNKFTCLFCGKGLQITVSNIEE